MSRQDSRLIERTVAAMETLLASDVQRVSVVHVLQLLGQDVPVNDASPPPEPERDPLADPLTGCLPVTAQGGSDADRSEEDHDIYAEEARGGRGFHG